VRPRLLDISSESGAMLHRAVPPSTQ
jgi:hypothetical protein